MSIDYVILIKGEIKITKLKYVKSSYYQVLIIPF